MPFEKGNTLGNHNNHARGYACRNLDQLKNMRWLHKTATNEELRVPSEELELRLAEEWELGRLTPGQNARQKMRESQLARTDRIPAAPDARLNSWYKTRYNRSTQDYETVLAEQGGHCKLCSNVRTKKRRLCWDHDHACCPGIKSCGKCVRGLLCIKCNREISVVEQVLRDLKISWSIFTKEGTWSYRAINYLQSYSFSTKSNPSG
jgi:hypothetical protein